MHYVKNDDMEDLFKKAASGYELNEELAADWNKIQHALHDDAATEQGAASGKRKRRVGFVWWLLAIPVALGIMYAAGLFTTPPVKDKQAVLPQQIKVETNDRDNNAAGKKIQDVSAGKTIQPATGNAKSLQAPNKFSLKAYKEKRINASDEKPPAGDKKSQPALSESVFINNNTQNNTTVDSTSVNKNPAAVVMDTAGDKTAAVQQQTQQQQDTAAAATKPVNKKNKTALNNARRNYAYIGITGNADLSFVKFQKTSGVGFGGGIVAGYHLKNGIGIQTGALYVKKNYYTKGKYFNTDKIPYFQWVDLMNADGNCHMWEIPLNVTYDFASRKKYNFFVTAGSSSYIMKKEYYLFQYEKDGEVHEKGYDYKNSTRDWFSVLNLGAGINIQTGNKFFIQAQPYYKVPLSGVGTGSLRLSSAGINVSVMRSLH